MSDKLYIVRVDGFEITSLVLKKGEYETQELRDIVKSRLAMHFGIPRHYIRLVRPGYKFSKELNKNVAIDC